MSSGTGRIGPARGVGDADDGVAGRRSAGARAGRSPADEPASSSFAAAGAASGGSDEDPDAEAGSASAEADDAGGIGVGTETAVGPPDPIAVFGARGVSRPPAQRINPTAPTSRTASAIIHGRTRPRCADGRDSALAVEAADAIAGGRVEFDMIDDATLAMLDGVDSGESGL